MDAAVAPRVACSDSWPHAIASGESASVSASVSASRNLMFSITNAILIVELLAVLALSFTGIIVARKKGTELIGVYTVSMMADFGGGTIHDLLIGNYPLYWLTHLSYALMRLGFALASSLLGAAFYDNK